MFNRLLHKTISIFSTKHFYIVLGQISVGGKPPAARTGPPTIVRRAVVAANDKHLVRSPNPLAGGLFFKSNNDLTSFTTLRFYVNLDETEFMQLTRLTCLDLFLLKKT